MQFKNYFVLLALGVVACGSNEGRDDKGAIGLAADCRAPCKVSALDKRDFLLQSADGFEPLAGTTPRLGFHEGNVSLSAGCNGVGGIFALKDGRLVLAEAGSTEIGCDPARHAQDEWLIAFITSSPRVALEGNTLTLSGTSAVLVFLDRELADPDRPLVATPWSVDTYIANGGASNFAGALAPTLLFREDGSLQVDTSCNTSTAKYKVADDKLTLSDVAYTEKACSGSSAAADAHIQKVVRDGTLSFEIQAKRLTLTRGELGLGAIAP